MSPFHSQETLLQWVADFNATVGQNTPARVAFQDAVNGEDGGLVIIPLTNASTTIYIQPPSGRSEWTFMLEPRPAPSVLTSAQMRALAAELDAAADLCAYIETRSVGHFEQRPTA